MLNLIVDKVMKLSINMRKEPKMNMEIHLNTGQKRTDIHWE